MPNDKGYASKAQHRFMRAAEARGDVEEGTASRWAHETPDLKSLPEKVEPKKKGPVDQENPPERMTEERAQAPNPCGRPPYKNLR
jgi:hypothetical protein